MVEGVPDPKVLRTDDGSEWNSGILVNVSLVSPSLAVKMELLSTRQAHRALKFPQWSLALPPVLLRTDDGPEWNSGIFVNVPLVSPSLAVKWGLLSRR